MELISALLGYVWMGVAFLIVLSIVVFVHELGHFLVARWCKVTVTEFSIGFGREIAGFHDKAGTRWRLNWIPLGGYVKFMDDQNAASMPSRQDQPAADLYPKPVPDDGAFHNKPLWQKSAVIAAGPIANFILAIGVLAAMFMTVGIAVTLPKVDELVSGGAAERAGLQPGDLIVSIDGQAIGSFSELQRIVSGSPDIPLDVRLDRGGQLLNFTLTPERTEISDGFGGKMRVGMLGVRRSTAATDWTYQTFGPVESVVKAVDQCVFFVSRTLGYLRDVIVGREKADQLRGPIGIAEVVGKTAQHGILPLVNLMAILSLSIGLFNLFPVPPLDGGHLMFYAYEAVRGKPMNERAQDIGFRVGLALILMLFLLATWNDTVGRWLG